ncbi:unnamed protein product [Mesocestoides corti]|uniref:Protein krueppel n=1 Tax=Mesocestoides corti TaxID=53468 RepID=A0A0R3U9W7_MESCO|nr:unnamed protein product [Mesocestoides corti]
MENTSPISTSLDMSWYRFVPELPGTLPTFVSSTPLNIQNQKPTSSSNRDSGLGSSTLTSSYLSPNAAAFSIDRLLGLSTELETRPRSPSSFSPQPLDLSVHRPSKGKTFSCRYCSKTYSSRSSTRLHEATHTMPFGCTDCGRRFSRPWLLRSHRRTHTGERPFACPICARKFSDRSNMRAHRRLHRPR